MKKISSTTLSVVVLSPSLHPSTPPPSTLRKVFRPSSFRKGLVHGRLSGFLRPEKRFGETPGRTKTLILRYTRTPRPTDGKTEVER